MRHQKTVGIIEEDDVTGLTLIAEPVGVICGLHQQLTQLQQLSLNL